MSMAPVPPSPSWRSRFTDLGPRLIAAVAMVSIALGSAVSGGRIFALVWLAAAFAVHWEWQRMIGAPRLLLRLIVGGASLAAATALAMEQVDAWAAISVGLGAVGCAALAGPGRRLWAATGVGYAGALVVSVCILRLSRPFGFKVIVWLFAIVWGTDIMAYFGGRLIGGPKLAPRISPGKTWSGTLVGVACGAVLGLAITAFDFSSLDPPVTAIVTVLALGAVLAAASQAGDLFESFVKRRFGVKDSSHLIPGHGGFMDRLDGFIAAVALAALIGEGRQLPSVAAGLFHW